MINNNKKNEKVVKILSEKKIIKNIYTEISICNNILYIHKDEQTKMETSNK